MTPLIQALLSDARQSLETMYGDQLVRVVLFGSQARGDARTDSDVDVLVVLRDGFDIVEETRRLVPMELRMWDHYRMRVAFMPFSEAAYADGQYPLMMNVHREGLEV